MSQKRREGKTMTTFENATRALARQLNSGGDLIPLDSLFDFQHFHPFCLVLKKRKSTPFWGARYGPTDYTLLDLLEPGSSPSDPKDGGNFVFKNTEYTQGEVDLNMKNMVALKGNSGLSRSSKLEVQKLSVLDPVVKNLSKERKLSADHPFLKEMREHRKNLYVVMQVVETKEEVTLEQAAKGAGLLSLPFYATLGLKASVNHEKNLTIPKGCVLAYRVRQLMVIGKDEWEIPHFFNDSMQTFPPVEEPGELKVMWEIQEDFKTLKEEVHRETQALEKFSPVGRSSLLTSLSHLLGKKKELQDLEKKLAGALDKGREVTLEAFPKDVLLSKDAMDAILYFLGALTVLSEDQQKLLVISLEKKILPVQLKLVESILEQNFLQDKEGVFPLRPDLLSSLREEELILITLALVELSGLEVQRSSLQYTWDPDALPHLCVLYAGLSLLQLLSKDS
ncbi:gasdermin-A-like isoform X3 [Mastomys coucha]|uniref:gasdermin-A-like isoform X3 n=1 Tax=Mastomys coucha TaxID=35658 RepID=UPI00126291AB|nr:gasdermin-A-like isoform X3 [Mastomys coucha]